MPSAEQLRNRLSKKLSELFQLDQPDLDFGFYRIMHAKAQDVQDFISTDLLRIVADTFANVDEVSRTELQAAYEEAIQTARKYDIANPDETEPVKIAKAALDAIKNTASSEADVYDHLYRFFERYYDNGDFISRRYYTRETSGKAAPFGVPYNGEEVKLHWANADQYYIKSAEYFSNFTFNLRQAQEVCVPQQENQIDIKPGVDVESPLYAHFRIVEAAEGEHGNVMASGTNKRYFILHADNPVALTEAGELVVNFEYRPDPKKTGTENTWRNRRNTEAVEIILKRLQAMAAAGGEHGKLVEEYLWLFKVPAPTESDKKRPLLSKYVNQYTARNTMDYFIHKDLGGFLRRELDFYIKNEVMRLDDIECAEAPAVESYLAKIKVLRKIAGKLIDFLAQLEDFQKKLWLKKKFVVETNYCITLDRIPEELYAEVVTNEAQCEEWVKLFAIDEIQSDLNNPGFSRPLTVEFLMTNNKLVLDTRFFDEGFKAQLVASIENFDEQCDGLLIHSENFQALKLLEGKYRNTIDTVYTDPPYNKRKNGDFAYKDSFQHSSWIAMIYDRLTEANKVLKDDACLFLSIDENEFNHLYFTGQNLIGYHGSKVLPAITNLKGNQDTEGFASCHEYIVSFAKRSLSDIGRLPIDEEVLLASWNEDEYGLFKKADGLRATGANASRSKRPNLWYPIFFFPDGSDFYTTADDQPSDTSHVAIWPINDDGAELSWYWNKEKINTDKHNLIIKRSRKGDFTLYKKQRPGIGDIPTRKPKSFFYNPEYSSTHGGNLAQKIFNKRMSSFTPKSLKLLQDVVYMGLRGKEGLVLDIFCGSGTTGHAVISLNRADDGCRKYILVEMGNYFDDVLKPRIAKVVYSDHWNGGKPTARHTGISHCFKYIRLESYEDTLNNLRFDHNPQRTKVMTANPSLKEDYMLRYLLEVETRGSQSLLNIDTFTDPTAYSLEVKKPGTDENATRAVDLIETFNYLIGLRVMLTSEPQTFQAKFTRVTDPELPDNQHTKLVVDGRIQQDASGPWWFRKLEGWVPKDPSNPNNGQREKVLIIWRRLIGDIEQDNLMLDEWFQNNRFERHEIEYDTIYVNGSNNLSNLKTDDENWKVHLIEEEFKKRMWNGENA